MEYKKIGDIIELHRGYDLPVEHMKVGNVPVVGSNGIVGYHNQERSISPTVTIGRSGSIGKVHFYDGFTWVHNTALYVSDFKHNNPLYIYYVLKNLNFENLKSSSVVPSLNRNFIYPLKVPFYINTVDQKKIAQTLLVIDQKIALNTRMNAELEAMAKQLYDYWFVQFDFPDKNGKPYKSSGGKMVWNEKLKRDIPAGWDVVRIGDKYNVIAGRDCPSNYSYDKTETNNIPIYSNGIENTGLYGYTDTAMSQGNSVTVSARGTIGHPFLRLSSFVPIIRLLVATPHDCGADIYLYEYLKIINLRNTGSVQPQLPVPEFSDVRIPYPIECTILKNFSDITRGWYLMIDKNNENNNYLLRFRDSLLPMLMNGQITIA